MLSPASSRRISRAGSHCPFLRRWIRAQFSICPALEFIKGQEKAEYDDEVIQEIDRQAAAEKKKGGGAADAESDGDSDEMLPKAIEVVVEAQMASTTLLQRRLRLGYARAARLVDELESRGIVGPFEGSKPRKVLISKQQWLEMNAMSDEMPAAQEDGGFEE